MERILSLDAKRREYIINTYYNGKLEVGTFEG
jgi:hypothetical protein